MSEPTPEAVSDAPDVAARPDAADATLSGSTEPSRSSPPSEQTGDPRVDAALSRLADLDDLPLAAQVTVFDDVHRLLQEALTASDAEPAAGSPPR